MKLMLLRARPARDGITPVRYTLLDDDDYETMRHLGLKVFASTRRAGATQAYAAVSIAGRAVLLHRFIMGEPPGGEVVDHRNHDTLDNRRSNLRPCGQAENSRNRTKGPTATSRYIGVCRTTTGAGTVLWQARVNTHGRLRYLGAYGTEEEAARTYDMFVQALWGPQEVLNFPPEWDTVVMMRPWLKAWGMDQFLEVPQGLPVVVRVIFDKPNASSTSGDVSGKSEQEFA